MIQFSELEERFNIFIERMKFQTTTVYWNIFSIKIHSVLLTFCGTLTRLFNNV